jgi:hypothetical protein
MRVVGDMIADNSAADPADDRARWSRDQGPAHRARGRTADDAFFGGLSRCRSGQSQNGANRRQSWFHISVSKSLIRRAARLKNQRGRSRFRERESVAPDGQSPIYS